MSDIALSPEQYTVENALLWGNCRAHAKKSGSGSLGSRAVHVIITAIEAIPIIGQITSLFEMFLASCFCQRESSNPGKIRNPSNPLPTKSKLEEKKSSTPDRKNSNKAGSSSDESDPTNSTSADSKESKDKTIDAKKVDPEPKLYDHDYKKLAEEHLEKGEVEKAFTEATKIKRPICLWKCLFSTLTIELLEKRKTSEAKIAFEMFEQTFDSSIFGIKESIDRFEIRDIHKKAVELELMDFESYLYDKYPEEVKSIIKDMMYIYRIENLKDLEKIMEIAKKFPKDRNVLNKKFLNEVCSKALKLDGVGFLVELDNEPDIPLNLDKNYEIEDSFRNPRNIATVLARSNNEELRKKASRYLDYRFNGESWAKQFVVIGEENSEYPEVYAKFMLKAGKLYSYNKNKKEVKNILKLLKKSHPNTHDDLLHEVIFDKLRNSDSSNYDYYLRIEALIPDFVSNKSRNEWQVVIANEYYIQKKKDFLTALEIADEMEPESKLQKSVLEKIGRNLKSSIRNGYETHIDQLSWIERNAITEATRSFLENFLKEVHPANEDFCL